MKLFTIMVMLICVFSKISYADTEYATFESFYKQSNSVGLAITGAAMISTTALSGGFGVVIAPGIVTASSVIGESVIIDYIIEKISSEYEYSDLAKNSLNVKTLPMPVNNDGPKVYEDAVALLKEIDPQLPFTTNKNEQIIARVISLIKTNRDNLNMGEKSKITSLLSLLYFNTANYTKAKEQAQLAIKYARMEGIKNTLPAFIFATSALYENNYAYDEASRGDLSYSVTKEPNNVLIPLLFSIYLDRMLLRLDDGYLDATTLLDIFDIMQQTEIKYYRQKNYETLLYKYFIFMKHEKENITILVNAANDTIKKSPETLKTVNDSLKIYKLLLKGARYVMSEYSHEADNSNKLEESRLKNILNNYMKGKKRLSSLVIELKKYQDGLTQLKNNENINREKTDFYNIISILIFFTIIMLALKGRKRSE